MNEQDIRIAEILSDIEAVNDCEKEGAPRWATELCKAFSMKPSWDFAYKVAHETIALVLAERLGIYTTKDKYETFGKARKALGI